MSNPKKKIRDAEKNTPLLVSTLPLSLARGTFPYVVETWGQLNSTLTQGNLEDLTFQPSKRKIFGEWK